MRADAKTRAEILALLNKFSIAYNNKDIETMLVLFSLDPDTIFICPGKDEKCAGLFDIEKHFNQIFAKAEKTTIKFNLHSVSGAEQVCWATGDAEIYIKTAGKETTLLTWFTMVLEKKEGLWRIMHLHHCQA